MLFILNFLASPQHSAKTDSAVNTVPGLNSFSIYFRNLIPKMLLEHIFPELGETFYLLDYIIRRFEKKDLLHTIRKLHVLVSSKMNEKNYDFETSLNFDKLCKDYYTNVTVKSVHVFFFWDRRSEKFQLM